MNEESIIQIATEHNVGDLALGLKPNQRRSEIINAPALKGNIFPGEVINKANPYANYQFVWVPFNDPDFYQDCRDDGYMPVIEAEWLNQRQGWEWETPEKDRFRWGVTGMLVKRDEFLMYRDEDAWKREQARRLEFNERSIKGRHEEGINLAQSHGLEVEGTIAGQSYSVKAPKRTHTVS